MFKNKDGKVRSGWKIAGVTAAFVGISGVISLIIGIFVSAYLYQSGNFNLNTMQFTDNGKIIMNNLTLISLFVQEIIMIITPIIAWKFIMKRPLSNMGLDSFKRHIKELLVGLLFGIISISIVFGILVLSKNAVVESWSPHFSLDTVIYLVLFILVGFAEEIYGRGFIMSVLRQTRSIPVIIIVSSLIFAVLHSSNSGIGVLPYINLSLVGVLFAYIYLKSGNIWMCIGYHITWNYFQGNVFGFKVSGLNASGIISTTYNNNNIFNGGEFGPEGGFIVTAVLLLGVLFVKLYYKDKPFDFLSTEPEVKVEISEQESYPGQTF